MVFPNGMTMYYSAGIASTATDSYNFVYMFKENSQEWVSKVIV